VWAPLTVSMYVPAGVPLPREVDIDPPPPHAAHTSTSSKLKLSATQARRRRVPSVASAAKPISPSTSRRPRGVPTSGRSCVPGPASARAVVVTRTVACPRLDPSSVTSEGSTVHFAPCGAPLQLSFTVPCNPFTERIANA